MFICINMRDFPFFTYHILLWIKALFEKFKTSYASSLHVKLHNATRAIMRDILYVRKIAVVEKVFEKINMRHVWMRLHRR